MATYQIPIPPPMDCNGDVATNWKIFWDSYEDYAMAAQLSEKAAEVQAATLKKSWERIVSRYLIA